MSRNPQLGEKEERNLNLFPFGCLEIVDSCNKITALLVVVQDRGGVLMMLCNANSLGISTAPTIENLLDDRKLETTETTKNITGWETAIRLSTQQQIEGLRKKFSLVSNENMQVPRASY